MVLGKKVSLMVWYAEGRVTHLWSSVFSTSLGSSNISSFPELLIVFRFLLLPCKRDQNREDIEKTLWLWLNSHGVLSVLGYSKALTESGETYIFTGNYYCQWKCNISTGLLVSLTEQTSHLAEGRVALIDIYTSCTNDKLWSPCPLFQTH